MSANQSVLSNSPGTRHNMRRATRLTEGIPSGTLQEKLSPEDAISQLLENKENEYQRYVASRAMRAIKESDDEKPSTSTLRQLTRQAGVKEPWRRSWPALLRAAAPPRDPELPDELQSPLPPNSRWMMDTRSSTLFSVFTRSTNPVEDFYLTPLDDVWRSHRYGVYGLHYEHYPNPGTMAVPRDGAGLYYRPNRKILESQENALPTQRPGVVTLEHVKKVASRAVGQFFPRVHKDLTLFNSWPRIDEMLGCAVEYFHHYFELRKLEEAIAQLECQLYDSSQLDGRRRKMNECVSEMGRIYSSYLLGFGLSFHHLQHGSGYRSKAASDRQIFEALNAFVAQCVWIVYRRPNVTVIGRELGRLFRTAGFDPARRAVPPPLDLATSTRILQGKPVQSASGARRTTSKRDKGDVTSRLSVSEKRLWYGERRGALGGSMSASSRRKQSVAASVKNSSSTNEQKRVSGKSESTQQQDSPAPQPGPPQTGSTSTERHAAKEPSGASGSVPRLELDSAPDKELTTSLAAASQPAVEVDNQSIDTHPLQTPPTETPERPSPAVGEDSAAPSTGNPLLPPSLHVSMRNVYGLYTGVSPPQCAVYGLLRNTSPLLRQSLSRRPPEVTPDEDVSLRVDRSKVGILGTPLQNYDDVLAAIDYEREEKQKKLQFLGPSSTRAGVSRVAGVVPYLLLPSKFFSPDA